MALQGMHQHVQNSNFMIQQTPQSLIQHNSTNSSPESSFLSPDQNSRERSQRLPITETSQYKIENSINDFMNYG